MDDKLQTLIDLQIEQNNLLKRYLWRLRFSLFGLLLMTTVVAIGVAFVTYQTRPQQPVPLPKPIPFPRTGLSPSGPAGDIQVLPSTPGRT